jgi:phosphoserine phosphatase
MNTHALLISITSPIDKYILCCVAPVGITDTFRKDISSLMSRFGIKINHLTASFENDPDWEKFKNEMMNVSNAHGIDMAIMKESLYLVKKKLILFDMDSTLIQAEVIDEMAVVQGIGEKVKKITERAMNGEINFDESLRERVALLKGMDRKNLQIIYDKLQLTPGTEKFLKTVKALDLKTAIVSGGFHFFAEKLRQRLGIDYVFANELEFENELLTGKVKGEIVNAQKKANLVEELAKKENLSLDQVVAIGDGANDLLMLAKAGLGIAYHAKEKVRKEARHQMGHGPMTSILYYLGIPGDHLP